MLYFHEEFKKYLFAQQALEFQAGSRPDFLQALATAAD
jgi:hypothetical protein